MPNAPENPYSSPVSTSDRPARSAGWRVAAVVSAGLGLLGLGVVLFAVAMSVFLPWNQTSPPLVSMLTGCGLCLGFGTSYLVAGRAYWNGRIRRGLIATGVGTLMFVVLFVFKI